LVRRRRDDRQRPLPSRPRGLNFGPRDVSVLTMSGGGGFVPAVISNFTAVTLLPQHLPASPALSPLRRFS